MDKLVVTEFEAMFRVELADRLSTMARALEALGTRPPAQRRLELIELLSGDAHSIKGGAQLVGLSHLASLAGALETYLRSELMTNAAQAGSLAAMRAAVGAIAGLRDGRSLTASELYVIIARLSVDPRQDIDQPQRPRGGVQDAAGPDRAPCARSRRAGSHRRLRVLLVEDQPVNRKLVHAIFRRTDEALIRNCSLLEAPTLNVARSMLASERFDLVLLDVRLPDGHGLDLARELCIRNPRPYILVVSASVLPAERAAALASGADAFISKPLHAADLVLEVMKLIGP